MKNLALTISLPGVCYTIKFINMTILDRLSADEIRKMVANRLNVDPQALSMQYRTLQLDIEERFADDADTSMSAFGSHCRALVPISFSMIARSESDVQSLPTVVVESFECALYSCWRRDIVFVDSNTVFGVAPQTATNNGTMFTNNNFVFAQAPFLVVEGDVRPKISLDGLNGITNIEIKFQYLEFGLS